MDRGEVLRSYVKMLLERNGSDLHLKEGKSPRIRVRGEIRKLTEAVLSRDEITTIAEELLTEEQYKFLRQRGGADLAFYLEGLGRFRGNFFYQMGQLSFVLRVVRMSIPTFEAIHIPTVFREIALAPRGLILVSGATSQGKSTTVAVMVDHVNHNRDCHVLTLEDPVEFVHEDDRAIISQREIGMDVSGFSDALKYAVRQDPDVIVVGEMRDAESFQSAIAASETGHLVISTVHAKNVTQCFDRILGFFPSQQREQVLSQLSFNLVAVSCQRLLPKKGTEDLVPAFEILRASPAINKLVREDRLEKISQAILSGKEVGMQTFNLALLDLYQRELISRADALLFSDNPQALEMNLKGIFLDDKSGGILGE